MHYSTHLQHRLVPLLPCPLHNHHFVQVPAMLVASTLCGVQKSTSFADQIPTPNLCTLGTLISVSPTGYPDTDHLHVCGHCYALAHPHQPHCPVPNQRQCTARTAGAPYILACYKKWLTSCYVYTLLPPTTGLGHPLSSELFSMAYDYVPSCNSLGHITQHAERWFRCHDS